MVVPPPGTLESFCGPMPPPNSDLSSVPAYCGVGVLSWTSTVLIVTSYQLSVIYNMLLALRTRSRITIHGSRLPLWGFTNSPLLLHLSLKIKPVVIFESVESRHVRHRPVVQNIPLARGVVAAQTIDRVLQLEPLRQSYGVGAPATPGRELPEGSLVALDSLCFSSMKAKKRRGIS